MKYIFVLSFLMFCASPGSAQIDSVCPEPVTSSHGYRIPTFAHTAPQRSPHGDKLYFAPGLIMTLKDLEVKQVVLPLDLPSEDLLVIAGVVWSPYDPDEVVVTANMLVDTGAANGAKAELWNSYRYRISTGQASRLTPSRVGKFGGASFGVSRWLSASKPGLDTFLLGYRSTRHLDDSGFWGLYIPATEQFIALPKDWVGTTTIGSSDDSLYVVKATRDNASKELVPPFYLNGIEIGLTYPVEYAKAYFSPSGKTFALLVRQVGLGSDDDFRYPQLWIYDVNDVSAPRSRINFQKLHCTYSFWGINPEFITDSTIAVSMHKDGDISSPLWEIGLDGHIVRQLTFLPTSSVARSFTPAQQSVEVGIDGRFELRIASSPSDRFIKLYNSLGQQVFGSILPAGTSSVTLDVSAQPIGAYFCVVDGEDAAVRIQKTR